MDELEAQYYASPLTKRKVQNHRACAIIEFENRGEFLMERENAGSTEHLRRYITLIGGVHNDHDCSPEEILQRTLRERFSEGFQRAVRGKVQPYKDFYVALPSRECSIYSAFLVPFSQDEFEQIRSMIRAESAIMTNGGLEICTLGNLLSGNPLPIAATGSIISEYTHHPLPNPDNTLLEPLGMPRRCMEDYTRDFVYQRPVRISTG